MSATAKDKLDAIVAGLDGTTSGDWSWTAFDHSCAALGVGSDPGCGTPHVLSVSPCRSCAARVDDGVWEWGRCTTPSEADASHIARCSPDTMRSIADAFAAMEAQVEALRQLADDRLNDAARLTQEKSDYFLRIHELEKVLTAIRDYPTAEGRRTEGGYPLEVVYDEFAYRRMVDSYRDAARTALSARGDGKE